MKKIIITLLLLFTFLFSINAQAWDKKINISIEEFNSFQSVMDQKEKIFLTPQIITGEADYKILPFLGITGALNYNLPTKEILLYEIGAKAYLPIFFLQPFASINYVFMSPGVRTITFEYNGQTYSYDYEYNYKFSLKAGLDVILFNFIGLKAELCYYDNSIETIILNIQNKDVLKIAMNSYVLIAIGFWF